MFWKKDKGGATVAGPQEAVHKKKVTVKDGMIEQMNALETGKEITYKLGPIYIKPYVTVVHNAAGKRFTVYQDGKDAAGNPVGNRSKFWDANEAKDIANWIIEREGTVFKA